MDVTSNGDSIKPAVFKGVNNKDNANVIEHKSPSPKLGLLMDKNIEEVKPATPTSRLSQRRQRMRAKQLEE